MNWLNSMMLEIGFWFTANSTHHILIALVLLRLARRSM